MRELLIDRTNIRHARFADGPSHELQEGQARLRLDLFSLTSNNITYAAMGEGMLGYWDFFPAPAGMGKPPCWGFATVIASRATGVDEGARVYGYFPVAETLDVMPVRASGQGFTDGAAHRAAKAAVYNQYVAVAGDPAYDARFEAEQALFRPLYATGWWAADCVRQQNPACVVITSASSKTALALAHRLRAMGGVEIVGLTSAGNRAYVDETRLYDRVFAYDSLAGLSVGGATTLVDFLGRRDVMGAVHAALGAGLTRILLIGATDWAGLTGAAPGAGAPPAGPTPEFFFVPDYAAARLRAAPDLGPAMMRDMVGFYEASHAFVALQRGAGEAAILDGWTRLAAGDAAPREGLVFSFRQA